MKGRKGSSKRELVLLLLAYVVAFTALPFRRDSPARERSFPLYHQDLIEHFNRERKSQSRKWIFTHPPPPRLSLPSAVFHLSLSPLPFLLQTKSSSQTQNNLSTLTSTTNPFNNTGVILLLLRGRRGRKRGTTGAGTMTSSSLSSPLSLTSLPFLPSLSLSLWI